MREQKPLTFRILAAIARDVYDADAAEWKGRIKARLVLQGFSYPAPDMLSRAMNAVEYVLARERTSRQLFVEPADWFAECKRLHDLRCGGRSFHANQILINAVAVSGKKGSSFQKPGAR